MKHSGQHKRNGFTLIEVMVVVGIIAVIFALAIPAFLGIGEGQAMRSGVEQLRTTMSLARQHAITKRERVYIVFPDVVDGDFNFQSFRVYQGPTNSLVPITPWRYLPSGIVFAESASANNLFTDATPFTLDVPFPEPGNSGENLLAMEFTPIGSLGSEMDQYPTIYLTEGWYDTNTTTLVERPNAQLRGIQTYKVTGLSRINEY